MKKLKWIICECCNGNGQVENPAFVNGFTSSEWQEMGPDDQSNYMIGCYDVRCENCKGSGKVQVADVAAMTFGEKREYVHEVREYRENARINAEINADIDAERRMGC